MVSQVRIYVSALILAGFSAPLFANPVHYTISFTSTFSTMPTDGSFTYDSATGIFSNFLVDWNNETFDLSADANARNGAATLQCPGEAPTTSFAFDLMAQTLNGCTPSSDYAFFWNVQTGNPAKPYFNFAAAFDGTTFDSIGGFNLTDFREASGGWTVYVPEPGIYSFILAELGLLGFVRKKAARRKRRNSSTAQPA
jgi:hypothetical protein